MQTNTHQEIQSHIYVVANVFDLLLRKTFPHRFESENSTQDRTLEEDQNTLQSLKNYLILLSSATVENVVKTSIRNCFFTPSDNPLLQIAEDHLFKRGTNPTKSFLLSIVKYINETVSDTLNTTLQRGLTIQIFEQIFEFQNYSEFLTYLKEMRNDVAHTGLSSGTELDAASYALASIAVALRFYEVIYSHFERSDSATIDYQSFLPSYLIFSTSEQKDSIVFTP